MAIDITCYTKLDHNLLQSKLDVIKSNYNYIFNHSYLIYTANEVLTRQQLELIVDPVEKYQKESDLLISEEFGLKDARSYFMVSVNDKSFPKVNTTGMAELLRKELGEKNIIVLLNGETLI
ncbi:MAG: hypothetical protein J6578_10190 [Snodgrassella sp.]|uniref:hypothetical protein n=1 Tax=Snodgrassella sp. TaxID=2815304 RepID=UPI00258B966C|nr:hypothetical protein [Snodgrassella sp.]MCO6509136.1 hypothetical protein [Snodgrassella sp.]MCO6555560.1 hypothetical protein [Gilliamella sp.]